MLYRGYTSMVVYWVMQVVTVVSRERAGLLHGGSGRDDCQGPMTVRRAEARAATGEGFTFSFSGTLNAG